MHVLLLLLVQHWNQVDCRMGYAAYELISDKPVIKTLFLSPQK